MYGRCCCWRCPCSRYITVLVMLAMKNAVEFLCNAMSFQLADTGRFAVVFDGGRAGGGGKNYRLGAISTAGRTDV